MKAEAKGILHHHFWGDYSAEVYLDFDDEWQAELAAKLLTHETNLEWKYSKKSIGIHINSEQLTVVENCLVKHGADGNKISSLAKSVDRGEPFTCTFELEHPDQTHFQLTENPA